jgi:integrase
MAKGFTALTVRNIKATGYHRDRGDNAARGLYLQVRKAEGGGLTRSWLYRFTSPVTQKERWMGLGPCDCIGLGEARDLARAARRLVTLGTDPIERRNETVQAEREAVVRDRARRMTFRQCADGYLAQYASKWSDTHRHQWHQSLDLASEAFGDLPVGEIDTPAVVKFLEPVCRETRNSGLRHRNRIENVLDWATVHKFREGDNPARWKGHLKHVLANKPKPKPHPAMPFAQVPGFLSKLRERDESVTARALEFTILTAARRGEALDAKWSEIDLEKKLWTIPDERMKADTLHTVPLSDRALAILQALPHAGEFVFIKGNKRIANTAMLKLLVRMKAGCSLHGFRSSFRDWAGECTAHDRETIEFSLAHQLPDAVERAYRRGNALDKRRRLMQAWSDYCSGIEVADNVVPMRA